MANYRKCPYCGGQTKEINCEICGRRTILTNDIYEEAKSRDLNQESAAQKKSAISYENEASKEADSSKGHIQTMLQDGRNFGKQTLKGKKEENGKLIRVLAILAIVLPLIIILAVTQNDEESNSDNDAYFNDSYYAATEKQYDYLQNYLVSVQSAVPLTCEIDDYVSDWFYISNDTPYMFDAKVELETAEGIEETDVYYGAPYGNESSFSENDASSCKITKTEYYDLNLFKTNIVYKLTYDDNYDRMLEIGESITEEDLDTLLKRIYCLNILTFNDYDENMHVMIEDMYAYNISFSYEIGDISITNMDNGKTHHITVDIL